MNLKKIILGLVVVFALALIAHVGMNFLYGSCPIPSIPDGPYPWH